jgi:sugar lactone lactonase YvrE
MGHFDRPTRPDKRGALSACLGKDKHSFSRQTVPTGCPGYPRIQKPFGHTTPALNQRRIGRLTVRRTSVHIDDNQENQLSRPTGTMKILSQTVGGIALAVLLVGFEAKAQNLFEGDFVSSNICEIIPGGVQSILAAATNRYDTYAVTFDSAGDLFVAERGAPGNNHRIVKIAADGTQSMFFTFTNSPFDGIPYGMAFDTSGNMYVSTFQSTAGPSICKFSPAGTVSVFTTSHLNFPVGLAFDKNGNLFVANRAGNILEFTNYDGILSTHATVFASVNQPYGIVFDAAGNLFEADQGTTSILEFNTNGTASVFASGFEANGLAIDGKGNLFATSHTNIIEISTNGQQNVFVYNQLNGTSLAFQPVPSLRGTVTDGTFQPTVTMPTPYYTTIVQASPDLVNWMNICTNTPPFTVTDSSAESSRFYRAVLDTNCY